MNVVDVKINVNNAGKIKDIAAEDIIRALEQIGINAEKYAKALCPVQSGVLRNSITHQVVPSESTVYIGTDVKYAPYVELGHHQEVGRYVPAIGKKLKNSWVSPKPFLKPAMADHVDEYKKLIKDELSGV